MGQPVLQINNVTNSKCRFKDTSNVPDQKIFHAHGLGVNSVSWAPSTTPGSLVSSSGGAQGLRRFVTGGSDNLVRIWSFDTASQSYKEESAPLAGHTDWVRDVAWSPTGMFMTSISVKRRISSICIADPTSVLQKSYIASASQDKTVRIWTSIPSSSEWSYKELKFDVVLWRVSWSLSGNVLAVSQEDNRVSLWKENLRGEWECVKNIEE